MGFSTIALIGLLLSACLLSAVVYVALLARHRKAGAGRVSLLGMVACVETTLEPEGAIIFDGELWCARLKEARGTVARGRRVRVTGVSGHLLEVEPTDAQGVF
jgi:membrane-bound ClpP family serine protease